MAAMTPSPLLLRMCPHLLTTFLAHVAACSQELYFWRSIRIANGEVHVKDLSLVNERKQGETHS